MHIRHLSGGSYETLERAIFLNQLPAPVRTALANLTAASSEALAKEAGTFMREFLGSTYLCFGSPVTSCCVHGAFLVQTPGRSPSTALSCELQRDGPTVRLLPP